MNMIRIVIGDDFVENNCCLFGGINTPLPDAGRHHNGGGGTTGPMGLAGALAQQLAGTIGSLALLQLFRPGVPCLMGTFVSAVSIKSGAPVYETSESMLGILIAAKPARRPGRN